MTLTSLEFDGRSSGTGPVNIQVRSSIDSYGSTLSTRTPGNGVFISNLTTNLSNPSFANLTNAVTFRIYGYTAGATTGTLRLDNVELFGSTQTVTAVPFEFSPTLGIVITFVGMGLYKLKHKLNSENKSIK